MVQGCIESLRAENLQLLGKLDESNARLDILTDEHSKLSKLETAKDHLVAREERALKDVERLKNHLMEANDAHTKEVLFLETKITTLQKELGEAIERIEELEDALFSGESESASDAKHLSLLEEEIALLRAELDQKSRENEKTTNALMDLQIVMERIHLGKYPDYLNGTLLFDLVVL
jgi:thyroid receptor-interacting protein 11